MIKATRSLKIGAAGLTVSQLRALIHGQEPDKKVSATISSVPHDRYPSTIVASVTLEVEVDE